MAESQPSTWEAVLAPPPAANPSVEQQREGVRESQNRGSAIASELKSRRESTPTTWDALFPGAAPAPKAPPPEPPIGATRAAGRGLTHGTLGMAEAVGTGLQFLGNRISSPAIAELGESTAKYWSDQAKPYEAPKELQGAIFDQPELLLKGAWWAYNLFDTMPSLAASIIPGVGAAKAIKVAGAALPLTEQVVQRLAILGGSVAGGGVGGSLEGAQTYRTVLERGGSEEEAAVAGSTMALASAGLNAITVGKVLTPTGAGALRRFLNTGATEALTEWAEEPAEGAILSRTSVVKPEDDPASRAIQGLNVVPIAGVMGGGMGVMQGRSEPGQPVPTGAPAPAGAPTAPPVAAPASPTGSADAAAAPGGPSAQPASEPPSNAATAIQPLAPIDQARADAQVLSTGGVLPEADEARQRNATLMAVYGENAAVRHVIEQPDQFGRLGDAMLMAAPAVERARGAMAGKPSSPEITTEIVGAIDELARMKAEGKSLSEVMATGVGHDISYEGQQLMAFLHDNAENPDRIAAFLRQYLQAVEDAGGVPQEVRNRGHEIAQQMDKAAAKRRAEEEKAIEQKAKQDEKAKEAAAKKAREQAQDQNVEREVAVAKAAGSGIQPGHLTAMEVAFQNARKLKGKKNAKPVETARGVQGPTSGGPEGGAKPRSPVGGEGAVSKPAEVDHGIDARSKGAAGNLGRAQDTGEGAINRGSAIAAELKPLDAAAHQAATSPTNALQEPSDAQREAGNYKKGPVRVSGLEISVENPAGSKRRPEWPTLESHYGYVKGVAARAPDKEHVDVFVKPGTAEYYDGPVFVVDQNKADGSFDEPKAMLGWSNEKAARTAYLRNYTSGWESRIRGMTEMTTGQFKVRLQDAAAFLKPQQNAAPPTADETLRPIDQVQRAGAAPDTLTANDIPADLKISLQVLVEDVGETVTVEQNARKAFKAARQRVNRLESLLKCLRAP